MENEIIIKINIRNSRQTFFFAGNNRFFARKKNGIGLCSLMEFEYDNRFHRTFFVDYNVLKPVYMIALLDLNFNLNFFFF